MLLPEGSLLLGLFTLLVEFCVVPGCRPGATLGSWINNPQPMVMDSLCVYQLLPSPLPRLSTWNIDLQQPLGNYHGNNMLSKGHGTTNNKICGS